MSRWIVAIGAVVVAFVSVHFLTQKRILGTRVDVIAVSCLYVSTDDQGAHEYSVKFSGGVASPAPNVRLLVDTHPMNIPVLVNCKDWGGGCYRDHHEPNKSMWDGEFRFSTANTPYEIEVRASTVGTYALKKPPRMKKDTMEAVCETPTDAMVASKKAI